MIPIPVTQLTCVHCDSTFHCSQLIDAPLEGGKAYALRCPQCRLAVKLRLRLDSDPTYEDRAALSDAVIERLTFFAWYRSRMPNGINPRTGFPPQLRRHLLASPNRRRSR